jgi:hypothetical protein
VNYFKSAVVGVVTALIAVIFVVLTMLRVWMTDDTGAGGGGMYLSISAWQVVLAALVGFAAGFWFSLRRGRVPQA